jgi:hypothetical protein
MDVRRKCACGEITYRAIVDHRPREFVIAAIAKCGSWIVSR